MKSFKQLTADGTLKRADAHKVRLNDLVLEQGFNVRDDDERLTAHVQAIFEHIMAGGQLPALEVVPHPGGKVKVIDGHCRTKAYRMAVESGAPIEWIEVRQFMGNDVDRSARILTSNEGLKLTQLETARVYARLRGFGLTPDEIARKAGKTRQHVDQLLILADSPHKLQQAVQNGDVSATEAVKLAREHGDQAGEVIREKVDQAKAEGKTKVTPKALKPWTPPAKIVQPVLEAAQDFLDQIGDGPRERIAQLDQDNRLDTGKVEVPARLVWWLLNQAQTLANARSQAEARAAKKSCA